MLTKSYTGLCFLKFLTNRLIFNGYIGKIFPLQYYLLLSHSSLKQAGCAPVSITYNQPEEDMETLYRAMCSAVNINQL